MSNHHLLLTIRNLARDKLYVAINVFGLSLGLTCSIVLALFISSEINYDRHHEKSDRIYRLVNEYTINGTIAPLATSSVALGPLLKADNPEIIESYTRFQPANSVENTIQKTVFRHEANAFYWEDVYFADTNVFDLFDHEVVFGNPETALQDPYSIAVSESFARAYFGEDSPIGEILSTDVSEYTVSLVFKDLPPNSHLRYDVLFSANRLDPFSSDLSPLEMMTTLGTTSHFTYVLLSEGFDPDELAPAFDRLYRNYVEPGATELNLNLDVRFHAQALPDVHFESLWDEDLPTGNLSSVYGFIAIAVFILLIACINYVNLATARSMRHAKSIGIRKMLGARRANLVWQYLLESVLFVAVSLLIALTLTDILADYNVLDRVFGKEISVEGVIGTTQLLWSVGACLAVGVISGLYPAFYLSSVAPMIIMSSNAATRSSRGDRMRHSLVFVQFTISIAVISITLLIMNQMHYVAALPLGFEKEGKLLVPLRGADVIDSLTALTNELTMNPNIFGASVSQQIPGDQMDLSGWYMEDETGVSMSRIVTNMFVGEDFLDVMGVSLVEGRGFGNSRPVGSAMPMLVNQTLVDQMGWEQPIGMLVGNSQRPDLGVVVGVTEDFHFESLYKPIGPLLMISPSLDFSDASAAGRARATMTLVLNVSSVDLSGTINYVEGVMSRFNPIHPFEFELLDNRLDNLYRSDRDVMRLTTLFAAVCIIISCLGLFGLASYTTEQRKKEIGIRRVLGATVSQIIGLIFQNIVPLVLASAVVSSILSVAIVNQWLNGFAYQVAINPFVFPLAAVFALSIAFITMSIQSARAVRENPIDVLRSE